MDAENSKYTRILEMSTSEKAPLHYHGNHPPPTSQEETAAVRQQPKKNVNQLDAEKTQDSLKVIKGMKFGVKE